jgi:hypothetical protein
MVVCPRCGQENPDGFRMCGMCGSPLAGVAAETEERKLVSVLFVDLVGHTAASDRADPEDVRARLRPYHQLLKREIERYEGTVEKFIGDAVMAVFGAPVSHEDDAERAVRSALRILEAVEELELDVRAAVATGEAVVSSSRTTSPMRNGLSSGASGSVPRSRSWHSLSATGSCRAKAPTRPGTRGKTSAFSAWTRLCCASSSTSPVKPATAHGTNTSPGAHTSS